MCVWRIHEAKTLEALAWHVNTSYFNAEDLANTKVMWRNQLAKCMQHNTILCRISIRKCYFCLFYILCNDLLSTLEALKKNGTSGWKICRCSYSQLKRRVMIRFSTPVSSQMVSIAKFSQCKQKIWFPRLSNSTDYIQI